MARSIRRPVSVSGIGLRTGRRVAVVLGPAPAGHGIAFNGRIPALVGNAAVVGNTVVLGRGRDRVGQVEHLLAACTGLGITDLAVSVDGGELPFGDGSCRQFVRAITRAGAARLRGGVSPARPAVPVMVEEADRFIAVVPARGLRVNCLVRLPHGELQYFSYRQSPDGFVRELAGARTFGPAPAGLTPARLRARLGLRFELARVGKFVYPARRRWPDEPARHKVLDLLGDLALLGQGLEAELFAYRPGHRLNRATVAALRKRLEV